MPIDATRTARTTRLAAFLGSLLLVAGCAYDAPAPDDARALAEVQQAITEGATANDDHAVVALLKDGDIYCSGVIVTRFVVATAAHCVVPAPPTAILFGAAIGARGARVIDVRKAEAHPDYDEDSLENDIGVVGLVAPSPILPMPIRSAPLSEDFVGHPLRLVGFGATSAEGSAFRKRTGATSVLEVGAAAFRFEPMPPRPASATPAVRRSRGSETRRRRWSSGSRPPATPIARSTACTRESTATVASSRTLRRATRRPPSIRPYGTRAAPSSVASRSDPSLPR
jgi:hypothetical protein